MNGKMNGHHHEPARPLVVPPMQHRLVEFGGEVQRLVLGPTDRLVLKLDTPVDHDQAQRLGAYLAATCGISPNRVIVLGLGMNLAVLATAEPEDDGS